MQSFDLEEDTYMDDFEDNSPSKSKFDIVLENFTSEMQMIRKSKKKKVKNKSSFINDLTNSCHEIDELIDRCKQVQQQNTAKRLLAMKNYESEVNGVQHLSTLPNIYLDGDKTLSSVDHNITRLLPKVASNPIDPLGILRTTDTPLTGDDNASENYNLTSNQDRGVGDKESTQLKHVSDRSHPIASVSIPSFHQKVELRKHLFEYLENAKSEEENLEIELEYIRIEDPTKWFEVSEQLYLTQKKNLEKLKSLLIEYQPVAFQRLWKKDPDYHQFVKNLNKSLKNYEKLESRNHSVSNRNT